MKRPIYTIAFIIAILLLVIFFEIYQNNFSLERKELERYIKSNEKIEHQIGEITNLNIIKSLYTSDYNMLKYFLKGKNKSINLYVYYKYDEKNVLVVQKIEIQNISNGSITTLK